MTEKVAELIRQRQDKDGMLRRALERIIQLYTDKSHFIYELLQNAEDAGASRIRFEQYSDRLIVLHDGHPFTMANLDSLCDIGKSDKIDDLNKIGEFGVGFKSVFGICETVELYSHPSRNDNPAEYKHFAVRIEDFTQPVDISDQEFTGFTTKFVFPYKVGLPFSGFNSIEKLNQVLSKRLQNLGITTLLFMKNLNSIDYRIDLPNVKKSGIYQLEKTPINDHCSLVSAIGETDDESDSEKISYMVFSRDVTGNLSGKTIDLAFAVTVDESGKYKFVPSEFPFISVYFPTETESKLKFIVQGPYRTTPNRSSVPQEDKDNIDLAEQSATLLRDCLIELRNTGRLNISLINILPLNNEDFKNTKLFECMFDTVKDALKNEPLLPCIDGVYASVYSAKLARGAGLTEVLTGKLLTELINDGVTYHWLPTNITETSNEYKALFAYLTETLEIEVIRLKNLRDRFNSNHEFLLRRDDEWLIMLYNQYASVPEAFDQQKSGPMLTAEFIKTAAGTFVAPYRKCYGLNHEVSYLPNVFLPSFNPDLMDKIDVVDPKILKHCQNFFREVLKLHMPKEYDSFIQEFKKRYENEEEISQEDILDDLINLLNYCENPNYREEAISLMRKYLVVRCIRDGNTVYVNPSKEKVYFPENPEGLSIKLYFSHVANYPILDLDYYESNNIDRDRLKLLGIVDDIVTGRDIVKGEYPSMNKTPGRAPQWNTKTDFRYKLNLDMLDDVLVYISNHPDSGESKVKSNFIFRFLQNHEKMLSGMLYISGSGSSYSQQKEEYSTIVQKLRQSNSMSYHYGGTSWDGKWLFTKSGELVSQKEITKRDLDTNIYGEVVNKSRLYDILGFAKSQEDYLEKAENKYDQLDSETKNQYFEIELRRRYGISAKVLDDKYGSAAAGNMITDSESLTSHYEFPSLKVRNWDLLRKHVAAALMYADPVKYQYKIQKVRVSQDGGSIDAYLKSMYKLEGSDKYACQMCHKAVERSEKCQITKKIGTELDALYLCMCPNCASKYRNLRNIESVMQRFLDDISHLDENKINYQDPVKISLDNESIWFTQTHIAEIKELMAMNKGLENIPVHDTQKPLHKFENSDAKVTKPKKKAEKPVVPQLPKYKYEFTNVKANTPTVNETFPKLPKLRPGLNDYSKFIGMRVKHKTEGYGVIRKCNEKTIGIEFKSGKNANRVMDYSLSFLISTNMIELVE